MLAKNYLRQVVAEVSQALNPLKDALEDPSASVDLLARLGWEIELETVDTLTNAFTNVTKKLRDLENNVNNNSDLSVLASDVGAIAAALTESVPAVIHALPAPFDRREFWEQLPADLLELLLFEHLNARHPLTLGILALVGIARRETRDADTTTGRAAFQRRTIALGAFTEFIASPAKALRERFRWGTTFDHEHAMWTLSTLARGVYAGTDLNILEPGLAAGYFGSLSEHRSSVQRLVISGPSLVTDDGAGVAKVAFVILPVPPEGALNEAPDGLAVLPLFMGRVKQAFELSPTAKLKIDGAATGAPIEFDVRPSGISARVPPGGPEADISLRLDIAPKKPLVIVGSADGSRLELHQAHILFGVQAVSNGIEMIIEVSLDQLRLIVQSQEGDSFLSTVLDNRSIQADLPLTIHWSNHTGVRLEGQVDVEIDVPVNVDIANIIRLNRIHLLAHGGKGGEPTVDVDFSGSLRLGPIAISLQNAGIQVLARPTDLSNPGNLGVLDLGFGFKSPDGVGLSIDAGVVVGAGFLFFDPVNQQYGGMVHLEIGESLNLNAIGLITTRLPDGSPGFSMLVLIAVEFAPPIQLGYGFALKGIGGILGVNRTVAVEVLRSGLRAGTLGSILLPHDPLANAPKIISDLNTVFPPAEGRFVFGPMILLAWGPNNLIQLQIGLVLELPAPARLFILGRLRVLLPEEKNPIVKLQLDALGVIDFGNGDISLDAVLYDSEIKGFVITGEMALRANVGATPGFVLAVGGFHPAFPAPAGFPTLNRVTISLATGDNPRLRLAAYFALTTNTVQFGASLEFFLQIAWFSVEGRFTFDALIQFAPFGLAVSMTAMVAIKAGTTVLLAVQLDLSLTGPTPWHIWGKAHFQLLFISVTVDFDATIGQEQPPPLPPPVDIRPLLLAALKEPRNWGTQLPQGEHPLVVLREAQQAQPESQQGTEPSSLFVHPLADLHVSQQVVPLDHEVTKFGNTIPEGEREFTLLVKNEKDKWVSPESERSSAKGLVWLTDKFAPAQFRTMSDDEKLRAPAFEEYRSGVRLSFGGYACGEPVIEEQAEYEESATVRPPQEEGAATLVAITLPIAYVLTPSFLQQMARIGSVGQATMHHSGRAKFRQEFLQSSKKQGITIKPRMFEVYDRKGVASSAPSKTNGESFFAKLESVTKPRGDLAWKKSRTRVRPKLATVGHE